MKFPIIHSNFDIGEIELPDDKSSHYKTYEDTYRQVLFHVDNSAVNQRAFVCIYVCESNFPEDNISLVKFLEERASRLAWVFSYSQRKEMR